MPLINWKINLDLNLRKSCVIIATTQANQGATFSVTDTKVFVPVLTLWTQDNTKLLEQVKSGFKWTINWNEYHSKNIAQRQKHYFDDLIDPAFQRVNRLFVLSLEDKA